MNLLKKIFLALLPTLFFTAVFAQKIQEPVIINGTLTEKGTFRQIFLDTLNGQNPWIFASAPVDENGNFKLVATVKTADIFRLRLDDKNYMMLILTPGEKITLKTVGSKLGNDAYVAGSFHTQLLYSTMKSMQTFDNRKIEINKKFNEIQNSPMRDSLTGILVKQFQATDSLQKIALIEQMEKHPASLAWIFFQDKLDISNDIEIVKKLDAAMLKAYPENQFVRERHKQVELESKTAIGAMAPEIALPDADGKILKLSSLKGKVVLIDFWASWCGPCRKENPHVVNLYSKYRDKGFEIFSVSLDKEKSSWINAIAKDNLTWKNHVSDLKYWKSAAALEYGVSSIPYTVLIDKKGKIVAKKLRGEELEKKIMELCR